MSAPAAILIFLVVIFLAALFEYFRTPPELRWRSSTESAELLELEIVGGRAVRVDATRPKSYLRLVLTILLGAPAVFLAFYAKEIPSGCASIFGINLKWTLLVNLLYYVPLLLVLEGVGRFRAGINALRSGYYPPIEVNPDRTYVARRGPRAMVAACRDALLLPVALCIVVLGHVAFTTLTKGASYAQFESVVCAHNHSVRDFPSTQK